MAADRPPFTIVGSGLAGALLACHLARAGHRVDLYEKRSDPRTQGIEEGRSINLALSVRGIHALREAGLADEVLHDAIPMRGRMMHAYDGTLTFQPYGKDESESINSVSRAGLNLALVRAAARHDSVRLFFRHRCTGLELDSGTIHFLRDEQERLDVPAEVVIGADGTYSAVRAQMQRRERFDFRQDYLSHGYKELTIPPAPGGGFAMERHALHIWPRRSFMMIALPNHDGSFTCTLFLPFKGNPGFANLEDDADVVKFFREQFPDAVPLMPGLVQDFRKNPTGSLVTIRCSPWHAGSRVVLIGDACHAVVPFLGQGMNAAFEDCTVLAACFAEFGGYRAAAFQAYEQRRKPHTDALAELAVENFLEMRDRVRSRRFLWRKRFDNFLHLLLPRWYLPLYTLVTFTRTPYADAVERVRRQERIVCGVVVGALLLGLAILLLLIGKWGLSWI